VLILDSSISSIAGASIIVAVKLYECRLCFSLAHIGGCTNLLNINCSHIFLGSSVALLLLTVFSLLGLCRLSVRLSVGLLLLTVFGLLGFLELSVILLFLTVFSLLGLL
jgi:hypothetical protein